MTVIDMTKRGDEPEVATTARAARWWAAFLGWLKARYKRTRKALPRWRAQAWLLFKAALKLMFIYSWRGAGRLIAMASKWAYDYDSASIRHHHATGLGTPETKEYGAAQRERRANLRARWLVILTATLPLAFPILAWFAPTPLAWIVAFAVFVWVCKLIPGKEFWEYVVALGTAAIVGATGMHYYPLIPHPDWHSPITIAALFVLVVGALIGLGFIGRSSKPLVKATTLGANVLPKPTAPLITEALCSLGNAKMSPKTQEDPRTQVGLIIDGVRNGPGWNFHFLLPKGVTAAWVQSKREELAGAMRFPLGCVWPSVGTHNPCHLVLDITDEDLKDADQEPWPVLKMDSVDLSKPLPVGTNQKGDWVYIQLAYANAIIGAVPRVGKTFFLRSLLMLAALDPHARVYSVDGKGTGDLSPTMLFAHRYQRGLRSTRPELIEKVRAMIRELRMEMDRRSDVIDSLSHEECPESKVTGHLIRTRPDLKLGWIVFALDETQMGFGYGDKDNREHKKIRQELRAGIEELVKLGPALGIIVILATQDVVEETVPNQISRMAVIRMCMKVEDDKSNNRILGAGAYGRGLNATMFTQDDLGIGYLKAEGGTPQIIRTVWGLDKTACESIAARGRALRIAAGTLTGDAVGEVATEEAFQVDLLADCRDVMDNLDGGRAAMLLDELREALAVLRPTTWGHLDNEALGSMLGEAGVKRATVYSTRAGKDGRGIKREWLNVATTDETSGDEAV